MDAPSLSTLLMAFDPTAAKTLSAFVLSLAFANLSVAADRPDAIPLWPHGAPGSEARAQAVSED